MTTPSYCEEAAAFYKEQAKEQKEKAQKAKVLTAERSESLYNWVCKLEKDAREKKDTYGPHESAYSFWQGKEDAYSVIKCRLETEMGM